MDYWDNEELSAGPATSGMTLSFRGRIALALVGRWGQVSDTSGSEDSTGRAKIDLMPEADVVARAFKLADLAVDALEQRGWVREVTVDSEKFAERQGHLQSIKEDVRFKRMKELAAT